jgi:hypothetical protein
MKGIVKRPTGWLAQALAKLEGKIRMQPFSRKKVEDLKKFM